MARCFGLAIVHSIATSAMTLVMIASCAVGDDPPLGDMDGDPSDPAPAIEVGTGSIAARAPSIVLAAPAIVSATAVSSSQIRITFDDPNSRESGSIVERSTGTGFTERARLAKDTTTFVDAGLAPATTYTYRVRAYRDQGTTWVESPSSPEASATTSGGSPSDVTAPTVPSGVTATAASCSQVSVAWTASTDIGGSGVRAYEVYRNGALVKQVLAPAVSVIDGPLAAATSFAYRVAAIDHAGNRSAQSSAVSVTTPACPTGNGAPAARIVGPTLARIYTATTFDGRGSSDPEGSTLIYAWRVCASTEQFCFPLADGAAPQISVTVSSLGSYFAELSVTDPQGLRSTVRHTFTVDLLPVGNAAHRWSRTIGAGGGGAGGRWVQPTRVAIDPVGNLFVLGRINAPVDLGAGSPVATVGGWDVFLAKYTATGTLLWARVYGTPYDEGPDGLAVDATGNAVIVLRTGGSLDVGTGPLGNAGVAGTADLVVARLSSSGTVQWARRHGSAGNDNATDVGVDAAGNVAVSARIAGPVDFGGGAIGGSAGGGAIVRWSASGTAAWSRAFDTAQINSLAFTPAGQVVATGSFTGTTTFGGAALTSAGYGDIFLVALASTGSHVWSQRFGGTSTDYGHRIRVDALGSLYVTGYFPSTVDLGGGLLGRPNTPPDLRIPPSMFVAKYTASGGHLWSKTVGGNAIYDTIVPGDLAVDAAGTVAITGSFSGNADVGAGYYASLGSQDMFVASFRADGTPRWSMATGSAALDQGAAVVLDGEGDAICVGTFGGAINLGGGTVQPTGAVDLFLLELGGAP